MFVSTELFGFHQDFLTSSIYIKYLNRGQITGKTPSAFNTLSQEIISLHSTSVLQSCFKTRKETDEQNTQIKPSTQNSAFSL